MNLASALMGDTPSINPTGRVISHDDEPAYAPAPRRSPERTAEAYEKGRRILRNDYADQLWTCSGVVKACREKGIRIGGDQLLVVIREMLASGEIRKVRAFGGRYFYQFSAAAHAIQILTPGLAKYKAKTVSAINLTRHWPKAKTGFTCWALARYLRSDRYADHAVKAMLADGELEIIESSRRTVYRLKEQQQ